MGNNLKNLREKRKLTQRELSEQSCVDVMAISRYESGARKMENATLKTGKKLSGALQCSIEDLIK